MKRRAVIDEDFGQFVHEVHQLEQKYYQGDAENKKEVKRKLRDAILNCKAHMGADLPYAPSNGVSKRFILFYQPRLKLLKKTISRLE